jgi:hypothetical protein
MTRRRRHTQAGAIVGPIVRAIEAAADRIVGAIREASAEQIKSREAMGERLLAQGARFLRAALDDGMPRTVVLDPPAANDAGDDAPESNPPPESNPRPSQ